MGGYMCVCVCVCVCVVCVGEGGGGREWVGTCVCVVRVSLYMVKIWDVYWCSESLPRNICRLHYQTPIATRKGKVPGQKEKNISA